MPIIAKDYSWKQSDELIFLEIPLHGVHKSKVDIFSSDTYIKVHFEKFLCEIFLAHKIVDSRSKCLINNDSVSFELQKETHEPWLSLEALITKNEKMKMKEDILKDVHAREVEVKKEKNELKQKIKSSAIQRQMSEDSTTKEKIDSLRTSEKEQFLNNTLVCTNAKERIENKAITDTQIQPNKHKKKKKNIKSSVECAKSPFIEEVIQNVPEPRENGKIHVNFTKREFPTPSREVTADMEQEWLKKQVEAQRSMGFSSADLRPEEMNPTWLKGKGDEFFQKQNYRAAINAYTAGIQMNSKMPALYANRASAQFNLGHFNRCVDDCTKALELLQPACQSNLKTRSMCIARRGAALCQIGYLGQGIDEMLCAIKLDPNNEELKNDIEKAKNKYQNKENC